MVRAIYLPLRRRNQDDDTRQPEKNEFQEVTLPRLTMPGFPRKHQNTYRPSNLLIRFALAGDVPIFLSNKRRTRDVLFRRR